MMSHWSAKFTISACGKKQWILGERFIALYLTLGVGRTNTFKLSQLLNSHSMFRTDSSTDLAYIDTRYLLLKGPPTPTYDILLDGKPFTVSQNLFEFLRMFQTQGDKSNRLLWADQICIDQRDDDERGEQVMRMGEIYSAASQVIRWLGPADEQTETAVRFLNFLPSVDTMSWESLMLAEGFIQISEPSDLGNFVLTPHIKAALDRLTINPYWERL